MKYRKSYFMYIWCYSTQFNHMVPHCFYFMMTNRYFIVFISHWSILRHKINLKKIYLFYSGWKNTLYCYLCIILLYVPQNKHKNLFRFPASKIISLSNHFDFMLRIFDQSLYKWIFRKWKTNTNFVYLFINRTNNFSR